ESIATHPKRFVESNGIDNESIPFPTSYRITVITGNQILRMFFPIQINNAERVWASDIEDIDSLVVRHVEYLESIRRHKFARASGGLAARVGFILQNLGVTGVHECASPVLQGNIFNVDPGVESCARLITFLVDYEPAITLPNSCLPERSAKINSAVGQTRGRPGRRWLQALRILSK